jgi:hypothetical protein
VFAGSVTAQVVAGTLQITGDAADNQIAIFDNGTEFVIRGESLTTVNSTGADAKFPKNTIIGINVRMGDGNDVALVDQINAGNLFTATASFLGEKGNDTITLGSKGHNKFLGRVIVDLGIDGGTATIDDSEFLSTSNVDVLRVEGLTGDKTITIGRKKANRAAGNVVISTESGADTISIEQLLCSGGISIDTGDGADAVTMGSLNPVTATAVSTKGSLAIHTGNGRDSVVLDAVHITGNINIDTGADTAADQLTIGDSTDPNVANKTTKDSMGSSTKGDLLISTGDGDDAVAINYTTVAGRMSIGMGRSDGTSALTGANLIVRNSSVSGNVEIGGESSSAPNFVGRGGMNHIEIAALHAGGSVAIRGGDGADVINIKGSRISAGTLSIDSGAGSDTLKLDHSIARSMVLIAGGAADVVEVTANLIDDFFLDLGMEADRCLISGVPFRRHGFATGKGALGQGGMFSYGTPVDKFGFQGITPG